MISHSSTEQIAHKLLQAASEAGNHRARPLASNFKVGAALQFEDGQVFSGANTEDRFGKTTVGACAERNVLAEANNRVGPLSAYGNNGIGWTHAAVWAPTPAPITPCGICRDFMASTAVSPSSPVFSECSGPDRAQFTIGDLLPLAGRGAGGDVRDEIETWKLAGGRISEVSFAEIENLMSQARSAATRSYIPGFSEEPRSGAVLRTESGRTYEGATVVEATTRLGGTAISTAVRNALVGPVGRTSRVLEVFLFTDGDVLRAPTGCDLQLLQELRPIGKDVEICFACDTVAYKTTLSALLPHPFGRNDLGY